MPTKRPYCSLVTRSSAFMLRAANAMLIRSRNATMYRTNMNGMMRIITLRMVRLSRLSTRPEAFRCATSKLVTFSRRKDSAGDQSWHRIAGLAINDSDWGPKPGPAWYPRPDEDELVVGSALWRWLRSRMSGYEEIIRSARLAALCHFRALGGPTPGPQREPRAV